jgi:hypothetical protein
MSFFGTINKYLEKLNARLDKKLEKVNKTAYPLRFSTNRWHRFIWKRFFKKRNILSFSSIKGKKLRASSAVARHVVHVTNLMDPRATKDADLRSRLTFALGSINKTKRANTTLLACSSKPLPSSNIWKTRKLSRDARSVFGEGKDFAFLKDMLDAGAALVGPDDLIFYSNLDCPLSPSIYQNLLRGNEDVTEFLRRDIDVPPSYDAIFGAPYSLYEIGVDGLSIRKSVYLEIRDKLPDCVIGEPHWDTAYSGILHKHYEVSQNTSDLYHIKHEQQWDDSSLSVSGNHNKELYYNCINYGLMDDELISLKKQTVIILLNPSLSPRNDRHVGNLIAQVSLFNSKFEVIFSEFLEGDSAMAKLVSNIKYLPILNTNKHTACLNQENSIVNCLLHQFSNFKNIIVFKSSINNINLNLIKEAQLALQKHGFYKNKDIIAVKNNNIAEKELDIYGKNVNIKKIKDISYINDDGLLELLNNYDPENI